MRRKQDDERKQSVLLVHGGIAEDMGADRFWIQPGIVAALSASGVDVVAPDRDTTPATWALAANDLAMCLERPATVVAGSNGVSVALRLALDFPELVLGLLLLWPATAGDSSVDAVVPRSAQHLLGGRPVRGSSDTELKSIRVPVAVMAADPETRTHQHRTVDELVALIPGAIRIPEEFPEAPRPEFETRLDQFVRVIADYL